MGVTNGPSVSAALVTDASSWGTLPPQAAQPSGAGAGLLNQAIDLDLSELHDGTNQIELLASNTWTGSYRVAVTGADLVLD